MRDRRRTDTVDAWFYDLGAMAKRIEANERREDRLRKRQYTVTAFVLLAFLLLAYRSEVNADRITRANVEIADTQAGTCRNSRAILTKYNALQDTLARIDRSEPTFDRPKARLRVEAYERGRILPLPDCPEPRESR